VSVLGASVGKQSFAIVSYSKVSAPCQPRWDMDGIYFRRFALNYV